MPRFSEITGSDSRSFHLSLIIAVLTVLVPVVLIPGWLLSPWAKACDRSLSPESSFPHLSGSHVADRHFVRSMNVIPYFRDIIHRFFVQTLSRCQYQESMSDQRYQNPFWLCESSSEDTACQLLSVFLRQPTFVDRQKVPGWKVIRWFFAEVIETQELRLLLQWIRSKRSNPVKENFFISLPSPVPAAYIKMSDESDAW